MRPKIDPRMIFFLLDFSEHLHELTCFFSVSLHLAAPNWPGELLILSIVLALPFESNLNSDALEGHSRYCS